MIRFLFLSLFLISAVFSQPAQAYEFPDPTRGHAFLPWLWQKQLKPTFENSLDAGGIGVLSGAVAGTIAAHQYDSDVQMSNARGDHVIFSSDASSALATAGGGALGIGITTVQLFFDQANGLKHARAISLTALSHFSLAFSVRRERPPGRGDYLPFASSFPSGHASSAFATAESLSYAYGWWVGVPANLVAAAIAVSRVSENAHWLSDVVAGAALGVFWAHASNNVDELSPIAQSWQIMPVPVEDGLALSLTKRF